MARARKLHTYGIEGALTRAAVRELPVPTFDELGYNYRMSDIAAAMMIAQLDRLPELLAARRQAAARYAELLKDFELITLPAAASDREHVWQSFVLTLDPAVDRGEVALRLREQGVGCNFGTYASHVQPIYGRTDPCPVSADLFARHLAIPMHANLTEGQVETVAAAVRSVVSAVASAH
jgi:dTDP-4-amino-4,6-dideoxygalactose transaminase